MKPMSCQQNDIRPQKFSFHFQNIYLAHIKNTLQVGFCSLHNENDKDPLVYTAFICFQLTLLNSFQGWLGCTWI